MIRESGARIAALIARKRNEQPLALALIMLLAIAFAGGVIGPATAETVHKVLASPLVEEGSGPDGCTPVLSGLGGPVRWEVRLERLLLDGKALVEASRQAVRDRFPLCIADRPVAKNAEVELSFMLHDGGIARVAGIVLRFSDPQDYYVVEADALAEDVRLSRMVNGERRLIANAAVPMAADRSHTLKVKVVDTNFAVSLDGKALFETQDNGIASPGRFGIWSRADSRTGFGDLFIAILD
jgi:hypothetical protein